MFEDADNLADLFRGGLPFYILITLPILVICSSNPVLASSEFNVQRMSQYDLHGVPFGCRASAINLEAKSLYTWSTSRHCVLSRFQDLTVDQFREIRAKAGGLILLLPRNLADLTAEQRQQVANLEQAMLAQEISIPVYFSNYDTELHEIIDDISKIKSEEVDDVADLKAAGQRDSALSEIVNSVSANGYQVHVSGAHHSPNKQSKIPIFQGELYPILQAKHPAADASLANSKMPTIIITAHIDNFGLLNNQLSNVDAAVFFTLMDTFSKVHNSIGMAPKYRFLFLLTESGNLVNFQGTKKWLDSNIDENTALQNVEFVLCLDSLGKGSLSEMFVHVSKPPKEGTHINTFYKLLKQNAQRYANQTVEGVHKKINLADAQLAWEHERYSMKRIPAFTISNLKSYKDPQRTTVFEESREKTIQTAQFNAKIIAETLATYVYRNTSSNSNGNGSGSGSGDGETDTATPSTEPATEIFSGILAITSETVRPWLHTRSSLVNNDVKNAFEKYLKNVKITYDKPDLREPDFMFYDGQDGVLNIYSVKPAVFDLFLTIVIILYLSTVYFAILYFGHFYSAICKLSNNKAKVN